MGPQEGERQVRHAKICSRDAKWCRGRPTRRKGEPYNYLRGHWNPCGFGDRVLDSRSQVTLILECVHDTVADFTLRLRTILALFILTRLLFPTNELCSYDKISCKDTPCFPCFGVELTCSQTNAKTEAFYALKISFQALPR